MRTRRCSAGSGLGLRALAVAAGLGGCSVDNRMLRPSDGGSTSDEIAAAARFCAQELMATQACYRTVPQLIAVMLDDLGYCKPIAAQVAAGQLSLDADAAADCLADLAGDLCPWKTQTNVACSRAFVGSTPAGGACYPGLPDVPGLPGLPWDACGPTGHCVASTICPGTCVSYRQLNEPCEQAIDRSDVCDPSLVCSANVCVPRPDPDPEVIVLPRSFAAPGQLCVSSTDPCGNGTRCASDGICVLLPSVGEPCLDPDTGGGGSLPFCLNGYCNYASGRCTAFHQAGDVCNESMIDSDVDPCGGIWAACDFAAHVCVPTCVAGNPCGLPGGPCCAGDLCVHNVACSGGICGG